MLRGNTPMLGRRPSYLSVAMINTISQKQLGKERVYCFLPCRALFRAGAPTGREPRARNRNRDHGGMLLSGLRKFSHLSHISEAHLSRGGITYSGLCPPTSVITQEDAPQA